MSDHTLYKQLKHLYETYSSEWSLSDRLETHEMMCDFKNMLESEAEDCTCGCTDGEQCDGSCFDTEVYLPIPVKDK